MARENARKNSPDFCLPDSERTEREEGCLYLSHKLASDYLAKRRILQMQERGAWAGLFPARRSNNAAALSPRHAGMR